MGLAKVQAALARLYTDMRLVADFEADPAQVAVHLGLTGEDIAIFTNTSPADVKLFARSLIRKRLREAATYFPDICAVYGDDYIKYYFDQYVSNSIPSGTHKPARDAVAFLDFLRDAIGVNKAPWWKDWIRYERDRIAFNTSRNRIYVRMYWTNAPKNASIKLLRLTRNVYAKFRPTLVVWTK